MDLNAYQLEYLGSGGTAETYAVDGIRIDGCVRRCCAKAILPELRRDADFMKCFQREARIGAALHHSNIVSLLAADVENGVLVFEYIDGVSLRELIQSLDSRRLSAELTVYVAMQLAQAFEYAHGQKVVHRDLSAANIMISCAGEVKLLDFGVAKVMRGAAEPKTFVRGKTPYMAPEQARNDPQIDGRADLFSLGVLCYELLSGRRPAEGDSDLETYEQLLHKRYPPVDKLVPGLPAQLTQIVGHLLEPRREARVASAAVLFDALVTLAPHASIRRELAELARAASSRLSRDRARTQALLAETSEGWRASVRRVVRATTPPTPEAELLLQSEQLTRVVTQPDQDTPRSARALGRPVVRAGMWAAGTVFAALFLWPSAHEPPKTDPKTSVLATTADAARGSSLSSPLTLEPPPPVTPTITEVRNSQAATIHVSGTSGSDVGRERSASPPGAAGATNAAAARESLDTAEPAALGTLRIGVLPFSQVWLDQRSLGMSPLEVRVPVGTHTVSVGNNRPERSRRVVVRAGAAKDVFFDLTASP